MNVNKSQGLSHAAVVLANVIWGLYATVCKDFLIEGSVSGWALCGLKMIGGALLFALLWILLPSSVAPHERVSRHDLLQLFFASMLINAGSQSCIILGLGYTSPIDGTVICSMAPIFTIVMAFLIYRTRFSRQKILGVVMGFMGAILFIFPTLLTGHLDATAMPTGSNPLLGNMLMVLSQVFGALYLLLFTKLFERYSAMTIITLLFVFSGIVMLPVTISHILAVDWSSLAPSSWLQLAYIIVFATVLAYLLLVIGQKRVSPTAISMYNYVQPITAMVSSVAIGVAALTMQNILATLLCLTGVYIVSRR